MNAQDDRESRQQGRLAGCWKTFRHSRTSMAYISRTARRRAERDRLDERDGRNEVEIQSVRVAPFSHVSRVTVRQAHRPEPSRGTRHSPWLLADFFSILLAHIIS